MYFIKKRGKRRKSFFENELGTVLDSAVNCGENTKSWKNPKQFSVERSLSGKEVGRIFQVYSWLVTFIVAMSTQD